MCYILWEMWRKYVAEKAVSIQLQYWCSVCQKRSHVYSIC